MSPTLTMPEPTASREERTLQIHCPACSDPIEVSATVAGGDLCCPSCNERFRVSAKETLYVLEDESGVSMTQEASGEVVDDGELVSGRRVDGYLLDRELGRGGMGVVYLARQLALGRRVALKVLPREMAGNPELLARFHRETRALASLSHPHIISVIDRGCFRGLYYFVMEFIEGATVRDLLTDGGLSADQAFRIIPQICSALEYAHERGVIHRDIKPENIIIDRHGNAHLADFGLSKLAGDTEIGLQTRTGVVMGTFDYMAPEQRAGARSVDHRADIYSLGVVLYEMLTGQLPAGNFEPPSRVDRALTAEIDQVVMRVLERDPANRYQQASEVREAVARLSQPANPGPSAQPAPLAEIVPDLPWRPIARAAASGLVQYAWWFYLAILMLLFGWTSLLWMWLFIGVTVGFFGAVDAARRWSEQPDPPRAARQGSGGVVLDLTLDTDAQADAADASAPPAPPRATPPTGPTPAPTPTPPAPPIPARRVPADAASRHDLEPARRLPADAAGHAPPDGPRSRRRSLRAALATLIALPLALAGFLALALLPLALDELAAFSGPQQLAAAAACALGLLPAAFAIWLARSAAYARGDGSGRAAGLIAACAVASFGICAGVIGFQGYETMALTRRATQGNLAALEELEQLLRAPLRRGDRERAASLLVAHAPRRALVCAQEGEVAANEALLRALRRGRGSLSSLEAEILASALRAPVAISLRIAGIRMLAQSPPRLALPALRELGRDPLLADACEETIAALPGLSQAELTAIREVARSARQSATRTRARDRLIKLADHRGLIALLIEGPESFSRPIDEALSEALGPAPSGSPAQRAAFWSGQLDAAD